jgi:hypothetical protein
MIKILDRQKSGEVSLIRGDSNARGHVQQVYLKTPDVFYGTSLLGTEFPEAAPVFGKGMDKGFVRVTASDLHAVLGRVRVFCDDSRVELAFKPGKLVVLGGDANADFKQDISTLDWPGQAQSGDMGLNLQYLEWVLSGMKDSPISITFAQGRARVDNLDSDVTREYVLSQCLLSKAEPQQMAA